MLVMRDSELLVNCNILVRFFINLFYECVNLFVQKSQEQTSCSDNG